MNFRDKRLINNEIKLKLKIQFDEMFGQSTQNLTSEDVKSLNSIADEFDVSRTWLKNYWLNKYLNEKFGNKKAEEIRYKLWPSPYLSAQEKWNKFFDVIDSLLEEYPDNMSNIASLNKIANKVGVTRITVTNWIKEYLKIRFPYSAEDIYRIIWTERKTTHKKISYKYLKNLIKNKDAILITKIENFNNKQEKPTQRYIEINCKFGHRWSVRVNEILYLGKWCPVCNEPKTQEIMRLYMENIFGVKFPETTLSKAYGISVALGGRLKFDGFNEHVILKDRVFKIAYEYDGIQHDEWPNAFHHSIKEFRIQKRNDQRKNRIALKHDTIIIRLKAVNNYLYETKHRFQQEIIRQFQDFSKIKLPPVKTSIYDPEKNSLKVKKGLIDNFLN